jgi:hypothetical protein
MSDHWGTPPQSDPADQPAQGWERPPEPVRSPEVLTNQSPTDPAAYLGSAGTFLPAEPPARSGMVAGRGKIVAGALAGVVAVAGIGVGAAYAAGAFGGGGTQPESLVPATAVGYVSFDLDPSLGQKVDALRFLRKFPSAKASLGSSDDIREYVFNQLKSSDPQLASLRYDTDVKPWIGDRFAVAALPATTAGSGADAVVVIQVTDAGKAKSGLKKLMTGPSAGTCSVSDGYAVCAQSAAELTAAQSAAKQHSLGDDAHFKADVAGAGARGIALAWGDAGKLSALVPSGALGAGALGALPGGLSAAGSAASGRLVATLRFSGANLELTGRYTGGKATPVGSGGTGVEQLPATTQIAQGDSVSPKAIDRAYEGLQSAMKASSGGAGELDQLQQGLGQSGFHLPTDLDSLLGTKFAFAFGGLRSGQPLVGLRSNANAAKAGKVVDNISGLLRSSGAPYQLAHVPAKDGYAMALTKSYATELAAGGTLGSTPAFRAAVPDASSAQFVLFANMTQLLSPANLQAMGEPAADANLKALSAIGMSAKSGSDGTTTFRLDVVTR